MPGLSKGFQFVKDSNIALKVAKSIVFMGDTACSGFDDESKATLERILAEKTDLFFILGDLVPSGSEDNFREAIDFCDKRSGSPIFCLCGNHELPDYQKVLGSSTYAIELNRHIIVVLDNSSRSFAQSQLEFLDGSLSRHKDKKAIILFHIPPPNSLEILCMKQDEWNNLLKVMDKYKDRTEFVMCGHIHAFYEYSLDGYRIIVTGGGGARLYDWEGDPVKTHHAVRVNFNEDGSISTNIIKV
jgi:predicted MPP superfamily phosphohydrolase